MDYEVGNINQTVAVPQSIFEENFRLEFIPSKRKSVKKIIVNAEGDITINSIEIIHQNMVKISDYFTNIDLHLNNINKIDLTAIQVLYYLIKKMSAEGKEIYIISEFNKEQKLFWGRCGYLSMFESGKLSL